MTVNTLVHYYRLRGQQSYADDMGFKRGVAEDLRTGKHVKVHDHPFQDTQMASLCKCPVRSPDASEPESEQEGTTPKS